ncbi:hypothetical protein SLNSH_22845 [Alsobacter soli]|uniref:Uncharacterized protein n=1 Tax=Alsobacter soli TaxID=2109933 RepID=A0A2T1HM35_9HYPH|nr:hypothetical protein [Alsobacter soli]PSC02702.1 hypothetical protein SLNSH_22845 [Alsobacter soli]
MSRTTEARLRRIEDQLHTDDAPRAAFSFIPLSDDEAEEIVSDWRGAVRDGKAHVTHGTLFIGWEPPLTTEEWLGRVEAGRYGKQ